MKCKICQGTADRIFNLKVLNKYDVDYFQCRNCSFIQTEAAYWLEEAYAGHAISALDTGILQRNIEVSEQAEEIIKNCFDLSGKFLDYGGGTGVFVRLMRDKGFDFYRHDKFCDNIFARFFDADPEPDSTKNKYELITAIELFEHLTDPLQGIHRLFNLTDSIFFTTELLPAHTAKLKEWWYFSPETGQHISFYSKSSLETIASQLKADFYSNSSNRHVLTRRKIQNPFIKGRRWRWKRPSKTISSLIWPDHEYIKKILRSGT